jgi:hypothetical protein
VTLQPLKSQHTPKGHAGNGIQCVIVHRKGDNGRDFLLPTATEKAFLYYSRIVMGLSPTEDCSMEWKGETQIPSCARRLLRCFVIL